MFKKGIAYSIPIAIGYIPVAFTFGILAKPLGFSDFETVLASAVIFAGASQFALVTLINESLFNAIFVPIFLNLRHIVYSSIMAQRFKLKLPFLSAFGLTDEVFATAVNTGKDERFLLGLEVGAYSAWVGGTVLGAFAGSALILDDKVSSALVFSFSALFLVLLLPNLKGRHVRAAIGGGIVALALHLVNLTSAGIILAGLIGPAIAGWKRE